MKRYIVAAFLSIGVSVWSTGARAEVSGESTTDSTRTTHVAKPFKVYNPAVNFEQFSKDLALTPDQQKEIKPILGDLDKRLLPLKKLTLQRRGQRGAPIVAEKYNKIRNKLDAEQLSKFNEMVGRGEITPFLQ